MKSLLTYLPLLGALALASCSTTSQVSLDYTSGPGHVKPGTPEFSTRLFNDQRGLGPMDLGTVRTQIGTPVEYVQTRVPVSEVVTNAFGYGLQARGMLNRPRTARYIITGDIMDLYCQMLVRPYGYARIRVTVLDAASGQIIHSKVYTGERGSSVYVPGSGSPVPLLRDLVSGALQDAVDRSLDDPALRNKLGAPVMRDRFREEPTDYGPTITI
ncbi:hypothetical protein EI77_00541 [Prosthecobacter fusiformis]|uniref:Lipoprotein n=1 Tax=Prosthecobacter fusiformis TaxID=48464 RepID=A0A4R7SSR2_9BACT|nr:hypothetical protein [Prosthecobacter fusiformis]TDU81238.1 hypothetical protein EI77_00541 [Prosthecobacter fusiformis]